MSMGSKRSMVALAAAGLSAVVLSACGGGGTAKSSGGITEVTYGWQVTGAQAPVQVASDLGYFKAEGLKVKKVSFATGTATIAALAGGQLDFSAATAGGILAATMTHSTEAIAPLALDNGDTAIYVKAGGPIKTLADLKGKAISVSSLGGDLQAYTLESLARAGVDTKSVKFVSIPTPDAAAALRTGRVAAAQITEPFVTPYADQLTAIIASPYSVVQPGPDKLVSWIVANAGFAKGNPKIVAAFQRAVYKALVYLKDPAHEQELRTTIGKIAPTVPKDVLAKMRIPRFGVEMRPEVVAQIGALDTKWKLFDKEPDTSHSFDPNWPPAAK